MGKNGKVLGILVMATMLAVTLGGCGSASKSSATKSIKISVVLKAINSDYWKQVKAGAVDEGKALGVNVEVVGPNAETDIAGQTTMVEDQITRQPSALLFSPSQPEAAASTLNKADAAGIPVILIDTDATWAKKKSFIGTGNEAAGAMGGKFIATKVKPGDDVVFIRGALGDAAQDQRVDGAKSALTAAGIKVSAIQPADSDRNEALTVMQNLLETHPNVKAVFCTNDEMALGAERALQTAGKKNVIVVGFDGSPDALKSILAGGMTASIAQNAYDIGKQGVEAAVKVAKGGTVAARIDTGTSMVTKANAKEVGSKLAKELGRANY